MNRIKCKLVDLALAYVVWAKHDSGYIKHLRNEVPDWFSENGPNRWMAEGTEQLLAVLSHHGHSGESIGFALKFFEAMARFRPWGPLTGEEREWAEPYTSNGTRQNKRYGSVFIEADGTAYDIDGRVFHDGDHVYYTSRASRLPITFPYTVPDQPLVVDRTKEQDDE
jgi:hypothetical protein